MVVAVYAHVLSLTGMFTVLKNLSNLMTIAGDYLFFGHIYSWQVGGFSEASAKLILAQEVLCRLRCCR